MSLASRGIVRLVHPTQHIWLRALPVMIQGPTSALTNSASSWLGETCLGASIKIPARHTRASDDHYALDIGLTGRGLEEVGDVTAIRRLSRTNDLISRSDAEAAASTTSTDAAVQVKPNDILVQMEWDGHSITSADELYHTIWNTFSGETVIRSPVAGTVLETWNKNDEYNNNNTNKGSILDEHTVLVRMLTKFQDLERAIRNYNLINEAEYTRLLVKIPPGRFSER